MAGSIAIPVTFTEFIIYIIEKENIWKLSIFRKVNIFISVVLFLFSFTPLFIKTVKPILNFNFWPVPGILFYVYHLWFAINIVLCWILVFNKIKNSTGLIKLKSIYVLVATTIGFGGGMTNHPLWYGILIPPVGNILVGLALFIFTYAIVRYRLLDIKVAVTRVGIFLFVYLFVLGLPLYMGYVHKKWQQATYLAVILATIGPFMYRYFKIKAEQVLLVRQRQYQRVIMQAAEGMLRIRRIDRLMRMVIKVVSKALKVEKAGVYLYERQQGYIN